MESKNYKMESKNNKNKKSSSDENAAYAIPTCAWMGDALLCGPNWTCIVVLLKWYQGCFVLILHQSRKPIVFLIISYGIFEGISEIDSTPCREAHSHLWKALHFSTLSALLSESTRPLPFQLELPWYTHDKEKNNPIVWNYGSGKFWCVLLCMLKINPLHSSDPLRNDLYGWKPDDSVKEHEAVFSWCRSVVGLRQHYIICRN